MRTRLVTAAAGVAALLSFDALADTSCEGTITRRNVVPCALAASPVLEEERAAHNAAEGRREAARPFLPSNPAVTGWLTSRTSDADRDLNWSVSLGQELELAGQSWLRVGVADKELQSAAQRVLAARATIAAQAWVRYFAALAARRRLELARLLEVAATAVATSVRGMVSSGLASESDADIADAEALRTTRERLGLEVSVVESMAKVRSLVGSSPLSVEGELEPLASVDAAPAVRADVRALQDEREAFDARAELLQRQLMPNATVYLTGGQDGFRERIFGVGVMVPIPLPQPLGRTRAGEVAESRASAAKSAASLERLSRAIEEERAIALAELEAATKSRALSPPDRIDRAKSRLAAVAAQVQAARVPVREALLVQSALVAQLKAAIDAQEAQCLASVRLRHAMGRTLEGDAP